MKQNFTRKEVKMMLYFAVLRGMRTVCGSADLKKLSAREIEAHLEKNIHVLTPTVERIFQDMDHAAISDFEDGIPELTNLPASGGAKGGRK